MAQSAQLAKEQKDKLLEYTAALDDWRKLAKTFDDFYRGNQFTEQQRRDWQATGIPLLAMNKVRPHIDLQASVMTQNPPMMRVKPFAFGDEQLAKLLDTLMIWRWQRCDGVRVTHDIVKDSLICGVGWMKIYVDKWDNYGRPNVMIDHAHYHDVLPDPTSRRFDMRDARDILHRSHMTGKEIHGRWGAKIDLESLDRGLDGDYVNSGLTGTKLTYGRSELDRYHIEDGRVYEIIEGYERVHRPFVSLWDENGFIRGVVPEKEYKAQAQEASEIGLTPRKFNMPRIQLTVTSGETVLDRGDLPCSDYPLVGFFNSHDGVPVGTSEIAYLKDPQEAFNAVTNFIIKWIGTSANAPWSFEEGSVDEEEFRTQASLPGGMIKVARSASSRPERHQPSPLPGGVFSFAEMLRGHLDDVTGTNDVTRGDPGAARDGFRSTLQLEEFANRRLGRKRRLFNSSMQRAGNIMLEYCQAVYSQPEIIRVTDYFGMNQDAQINTGAVNDVTAGAYDITVVADSTMATAAQAKEAIAQQRLQMGIYDVEQFIKESEILDKEELLARRSEVAQAQGEAKGLEQQLRSIQIQMTNLEGQVRQAKRAQATSEFETELDLTLGKEKLKQQEELMKLRDQKRRLATTAKISKQQNP